MAKELFEFYCSGSCQGYFRAKLRTNIKGDYVIICPNCRHEHFRKIRKGRITSDRHTKTEKDAAERIMAPMSSFSIEPVMEHPAVGKRGHDSAVVVDDKTKRQLLWARHTGMS